MSNEHALQLEYDAGRSWHALVGNTEEFAVLSNNLDEQISQCRQRNQVMLLKRGAEGASLYSGSARLDTGIYQLEALKPYGSGDAFLGNLLVNYMHSGDWSEAVEAGSAAAALVVSRRGCASAMPTPEQIQSLQQKQSINPISNWS